MASLRLPLAVVCLLACSNASALPERVSRIAYCGHLLARRLFPTQQGRYANRFLEHSLAKARLDDFNFPYLRFPRGPFGDEALLQEAALFFAVVPEDDLAELLYDGRYPVTPDQLLQRLRDLELAPDTNLLVQGLVNLYARRYAATWLPHPAAAQRVLAQVDQYRQLPGTRAADAREGLRELYEPLRTKNRLRNYVRRELRLVREGDRLRLASGLLLEVLRTGEDGSLVVRIPADRAVTVLPEMSSLAYGDALRRSQEKRSGFEGKLYASGFVDIDDAAALYAFLQQTGASDFALVLHPERDGHLYARTDFELVENYSSVFYRRGEQQALLESLASPERAPSAADLTTLLSEKLFSHRVQRLKVEYRKEQVAPPQRPLVMPFWRDL